MPKTCISISIYVLTSVSISVSISSSKMVRTCVRRSCSGPSCSSPSAQRSKSASLPSVHGMCDVPGHIIDHILAAVCIIGRGALKDLSQNLVGLLVPSLTVLTQQAKCFARSAVHVPLVEQWPPVADVPAWLDACPRGQILIQRSVPRSGARI